MWTEKKVLDVFNAKKSGNTELYDKAPDFVKEYVDYIEKISESSDYDDVQYITENLRNHFVGEIEYFNGRPYVSVTKGKPIGKVVAACITLENGERRLGFGVSKIHPDEKLNISLIGNHIAFLEAIENAKQNRPFSHVLFNEKVTDHDRRQIENFYIRAYKYFRFGDENLYKRFTSRKDKRFEVLISALKSFR